MGRGHPSGMPMGVHSQTGQLPGSRGAAAAVPGPLPPEQLLRSGGGDGPPLADSTSPTWSGELGAPDPISVLVDDAARILLTMTGDLPVVAPWWSRRFAREVALVRRHLEPVCSPEVLASSFGREAFHVLAAAPGAAGTTPSSAGAVRVAYAIRWIELQLDLDLPPWGSWLGDSRPRRRAAV